tara:strand:- start:137 stop:346 length:210 start_codon:yes stop_codon:yes gene_type:complete
MYRIELRHQHQEYCQQCIELQNMIQLEEDKHNIHIEKYESIIHHQNERIQRLNEIIDWLKKKLNISESY